MQPISNQIPNALSFARLLGSLALLWWLPNLSVTAILLFFGLLGLTDFLDGWLARRWQITSETGALFDGIADLVFYPTAAWLLYSFHPEVVLANAMLIGVTFGLLTLMMAVSIRRCGRLILLHTHLSRLGGLAAVVAVFATFLWTSPLWIAGVALLYCMAFLESILILWRYGDVPADTRSLWALQRGH
jgi:phosphatidylglycerophosphate synthase